MPHTGPRVCGATSCRVTPAAAAQPSQSQPDMCPEDNNNPSPAKHTKTACVHPRGSGDPTGETSECASAGQPRETKLGSWKKSAARPRE